MIRGGLFILLLSSCAGAATAAGATPAATRPTTSTAPVTTAPDHSPVLAKFGNRKITQGQFDRAAAEYINQMHPSEDEIRNARQQWLLSVLQWMPAAAYAAEHPELGDRSEAEARVASNEEQLARQGRTLEQMLERYAMTRDDMANFLRARTAIDAYGRDEKAVADFYETHKDGFDGTLVTAKHILIQVPRLFARPQDHEKARAKLAAIKKEIESGKLTFDEAIHRYSEDPGKSRSATLPPFPRYGRMVEPFAAAAFALKPGEISDIVQTDYGYHLIQVVDRTKGEALTLEQARPTIQRHLSSTENERITKEQLAKQPVEVFIEYVPPPPPPPPPTRPAAPPSTMPTVRRIPPASTQPAAGHPPAGRSSEAPPLPPGGPTAPP